MMLIFLETMNLSISIGKMLTSIVNKLKTESYELIKSGVEKYLA